MPLKTTPLYNLHRELGAKMVPFGGWHMPVQYSGVLEEHLRVRNAVGIFDVSHMGEIEVAGRGARPFLQTLLTNDLETLDDGAILYTMMCNEDGGVVDDLLVHRLSADRYFLCVNAANAEKDHQWIERAAENLAVEVRDTGPETAQLAVQGQHAEPTLEKLSDVPLGDIKYYHFKTGKIQHIDCVIARTGYTGEDGFEIYCPAGRAEPLFREILSAGKEYGILPIGLGARDTLRLEMGYALYGNEIDGTSCPLERGLGWVVKLNKADFIGRSALLQKKAAGLRETLAGIRLLERGVPRSHHRVLHEGRETGELTSGTFSPMLKTGIGLARIARDCAVPGTRVEVEIRGRKVPAEVARPPFVPSRVKKN